jgi:hypothetical protein
MVTPSEISAAAEAALRPAPVYRLRWAVTRKEQGDRE